MLISDAIDFNCLFFSRMVLCRLFTLWMSMSPLRFTMLFFNSRYIFSFSDSRNSFSTTSSVLAIKRFCRFWIFFSNS